VAIGFQTCQSEQLYSGLRSDNPFLTPAEMAAAQAIEAANANPVKTSNGRGDELIFTLNFTVPFEAIYAELFPEDQEKINELFEGGFSGLGAFFPEMISVYQEETTGTTIAVPKMSKFKAYPMGDGFRIGINTFRGEVGVFVYSLIQKTPSDADGKRRKIQLMKEEILSSRRNWEKKNGKDDVVKDLLEGNIQQPYYSELIERVAKDEAGKLEEEFFGSITVNEQDLLAMSILAKTDQKSESQKADLNRLFRLMQICTILTDFAYY
jgi:hypothetical protein